MSELFDDVFHRIAAAHMERIRREMISGMLYSSIPQPVSTATRPVEPFTAERLREATERAESAMQRTVTAMTDLGSAAERAGGAIRGMIPAMLNGLQIIESPYAYKDIVKTRGIPSATKPNTQRPYFRRVVVRTYPLLLLKHINAIVCHPTIVKELKERFSQ